MAKKKATEANMLKSWKTKVGEFLEGALFEDFGGGADLATPSAVEQTSLDPSLIKTASDGHTQYIPVWPGQAKSAGARQ
eukprot:6199110-Alexandrium_andersonii.AAC.1